MKPVSLALLALAIPALALAGCTARTEAPTARYASLDRLVDGGGPGAAGAEGPVPGRPVLRLPAWVGAQSVRSTRGDAAAFVQEIALAAGAGDGDGGDFAEIRVLRGTAPDPDAPAPRKPSEAGIRAELAAIFPGVAMQVVARPARNAYGPYGLAVGRRTDGLRCLYAWQWLESEGTGAASLRLRLCRARTPLDALAGAVDHLGFDAAGLGPAPTPAARRPTRSAGVRRHRAVHVAAALPVQTSQRQSVPQVAPTWAPVPPVASERTPSAPPRTELPPEALRGPARSPGPGQALADVARR